MIKRIYFFTILVFGISLVTSARPSDSMRFLLQNPVTWQFYVEEISDAEVELVFIAKLDTGCYIYSQYSSKDGPLGIIFEFNESSDYIRVGTVSEPNPSEKMNSLFGCVVKEFMGTISFRQKIRRTSTKAFVIEGLLFYQLCKYGRYVAPDEYRFSFNVPEAKKDVANALSDSFLPASTSARKNNRKIGPSVQFEETEHDFGMVAVKSKDKCTFTFRNVGDEPLRMIKKPKSAYTWLTITQYDTMVMPGDMGKICIELSTYHTYGQSFNKKISIHFNDGQRYSLSVKADISDQNGFWIVAKDGKYGVVDKTQRAIIPFEYDKLSSCDMGYNACKNGYWGVIDNRGNIIIHLIYDGQLCFKNNKSYAKKNNKCGVINSNGQVVIPMVYEELDNIAGRYMACRNGKWGVIDANGKVIIPIEYERKVYVFGGETKKNGKWGIVNRWGNEIVSFNFDSISNKHGKNGYSVQKKGKWGFVDTTGRMVLPVEYDEALYDREGPAKKNGKWGAVSSTGKVIVPFVYDSVKYGLKAYDVKRNGKWGVVDAMGRLVISIEYDEPIGRVGGPAKKNGKWGIVGENGKVIVGFYYEDIHRDGEHFVARRNGKYGVINKLGKLVLPIEYDEIEYTTKDKVMAMKDQKWYWVDYNNRIIGDATKDYKEKEIEDYWY